MKKVFLTSAALLAFAAFTHAQNVASLSQNGSALTANASQTGNEQKSTIYQTDAGNFASTDQSGQAGNSASISQATFSYSNRAGIVQKNGSGNNATIDQNGSETSYGYDFFYWTDTYRSGSPFSQVSVKAGTSKEEVISGGGNWTDILQDGKGNKAYVSQSNWSYSNDVTISQTNSSNNSVSLKQEEYSHNNKVVVNQTDGGNVGNDVQIEQIGNLFPSSKNNEITVSQSQSGNQAIVKQNAGGVYYSEGNKAIVTQNGVNGKVEVYEVSDYNGTSGVGYAKVTQSNTSANSTVLVDQKSYGWGRNATVSQTGTGDVSIVQRNDWNSAKVDQNGGLSTKNVASIDQRTWGGSADINQDGNDINATIKQNGGGSNYALIEQSLNAGNVSSKVEVSQVSVSNSVVEVTQGDGSMASTSSKVTVDQFDGQKNKAYLKQSGDSDLASVTQNGSNNQLFGAENGLLDKTNPALQQGSGNSFTLVQTSTGAGNTAFLLQSGASNVASISQGN